MRIRVTQWLTGLLLGLLFGAVSTSNWVAAALLVLMALGTLGWRLYSIIGAVDTLGAATAFSSLFGVYLSPPKIPQLMTYRVLQLLHLPFSFRQFRATPWSLANAFMMVFILYTGIVFGIYGVLEGLGMQDIQMGYYIFSSLLIYVAIALKAGDEKFARILVCGLLAFWLANVSVGFVEFTTGWHLPFSDPSRYTVTLRNVPLGFFPNHNDFAGMIAIILPFWFLLPRWNPTWLTRCLAIFTTSVSAAYILIAGSLTAFASILVSVIAYLGSLESARRRTIPLWVLAIIILLGIYELQFLGELPLAAKLEARANPMPLDDTRLLTYQTSLRLIAERPFGIPPTEVAVVLPTNPHSMWLELGLYFGIPGLILFIAFYGTLWWGLFRAKQVYFVRKGFWPYLWQASFVAISGAVVAVNGPSRVFSGFNILWFVLGISALVPLYGGSQNENS